MKLLGTVGGWLFSAAGLSTVAGVLIASLLSFGTVKVLGHLAYVERTEQALLAAEAARDTALQANEDLSTELFRRQAQEALADEIVDRMASGNRRLVADTVGALEGARNDASDGVVGPRINAYLDRLRGDDSDRDRGPDGVPEPGRP